MDHLSFIHNIDNTYNISTWIIMAGVKIMTNEKSHQARFLRPLFSIPLKFLLFLVYFSGISRQINSIIDSKQKWSFVIRPFCMQIRSSKWSVLLQMRDCFYLDCTKIYGNWNMLFASIGCNTFI